MKHVGLNSGETGIKRHVGYFRGVTVRGFDSNQPIQEVWFGLGRLQIK